MKLELKHLAPYLPYGLKIKCDYYNTYGSHICEIKELSIRYYYQIMRGKSKPILRPLSDLVEYVDCPDVMGEKIIPISALLDISLGLDWSHSDYLEWGQGKNEWWVGFKDKPCSYFGYNSDNGSFYYVDKHNNHQSVKKQVDLFQKLYEWHFDVHSLIDAGLAIDVNTLKK